MRSWFSARVKFAVASGWAEVHPSAMIGSYRLMSTVISRRLKDTKKIQCDLIVEYILLL